MLATPADELLLDQDAWYAWLRQELADSPRRLAHITTVWQRGRNCYQAAGNANEFALASLLHDVGRALDPEDREPHALVGARFLRGLGLPEPLVLLVAHHTGARYEAELRGFVDQLSEFPFVPSGELDALTFIDGTTGPDGEVLDPRARLDDIAARYGGDSWQVRALVSILDQIERGRILCEP